MEIRRYRRTPIEFEAVRFDAETHDQAKELAAWCGGEFGYYVMEPGKKANWFISFTDGRGKRATLRHGDLLERYVDGSFYRNDPKLFEAVNEPLPQAGVDEGTGIKTMLLMLEHTAQAVQLNTEADWRAAVDWLDKHRALYAFGYDPAKGGTWLEITTRIGTSTAHRGDWLVLGRSGLFYVFHYEDFKPFDAARTSAETCGAWGGCVLPKGHNQGRADIPENHVVSQLITERPTP